MFTGNNRAVFTNLPAHWQTFKEMKRKMQRECRRAFYRYMFNSIQDPYLSGKRKKLYHYIKSLRSDQCGISTVMVNDTCYTDNQTKANILNSYFPLCSLEMTTLNYLQVCKCIEWSPTGHSFRASSIFTICQ